jgi:hypothetical protein
MFSSKLNMFSSKLNMYRWVGLTQDRTGNKQEYIGLKKLITFNLFITIANAHLPSISNCWYQILLKYKC